MRRTIVILIPAAVLIVVAAVVVVSRSKSASESVSPPTQPTRQYQESPMLRDRVDRGERPPVEQRLPENPMVITPAESVGRYDSEPKKPRSP